MEDMVCCIQETVLEELKKEFPEQISSTKVFLPIALDQIYTETKRGFVIIIDEGDCVFREKKQDTKAHVSYFDDESRDICTICWIYRK